jgi:hypothetical protein
MASTILNVIEHTPVRVMLCQRTPLRYMAAVRIGLYLHWYLTTAPENGELSASFLGRFPPGKDALVPIEYEAWWAQSLSRRFGAQKPTWMFERSVV